MTTQSATLVWRKPCGCERHELVDERMWHGNLFVDLFCGYAKRIEGQMDTLGERLIGEQDLERATHVAALMEQRDNLIDAHIGPLHSKFWSP